MTLPSYGKIYNIGHPAVRELFDGPVVVEEKIDGSQLSFGIVNGELCCRSKGKELILTAPDKLFEIAVEVVSGLKGKIPEGWVFRCEYLKSPRHNAIAYRRVPLGHMVLFDVSTGGENYLSSDAKNNIWARALDLEPVPVLFVGEISSADELKELLDRESVLGGSKVEGVVVKNYNRWCVDGKTMMGKYVSESFKEINDRQWKAAHKTGAEIREQIGQALRTDRRWEKAVEALRDAGQLQHAPQDIGPLMKAVQRDLTEECEAVIKEKLYEWAAKDIVRIATRGLPEWYKARLLGEQFDQGGEHG